MKFFSMVFMQLCEYLLSQNKRFSHSNSNFSIILTCAIVCFSSLQLFVFQMVPKLLNTIVFLQEKNPWIFCKERKKHLPRKMNLNGCKRVENIHLRKPIWLTCCYFLQQMSRRAIKEAIKLQCQIHCFDCINRRKCHLHKHKYTQRVETCCHFVCVSIGETLRYSHSIQTKWSFKVLSMVCDV